MNKRPISCLSLFLMLGSFLCLFLIQRNVITVPQEDKILAADSQFVDGQTVTAAGVISNKENKEEQQIIYICKASVISNQKQINHISLIIYLESTTDLSIGNSIQITGNCYQFQNPTNPGEFNQAFYYKSLGIDYRMYSSNVNVTNKQVNKAKEFLFRIRTRCGQMFSKLADEKEAGD